LIIKAVWNSSSSRTVQDSSSPEEFAAGVNPEQFVTEAPQEWFCASLGQIRNQKRLLVSVI
jgi:hypothetical protein